MRYRRAGEVAFTARAACEGDGIRAGGGASSNAARWCRDSQGLGLHMVILAGQEAEVCARVCVCVLGWGSGLTTSKPAGLGQSTGTGGSGRHSPPFFLRKHPPSHRLRGNGSRRKWNPRLLRGDERERTVVKADIACTSIGLL